MNTNEIMSAMIFGDDGASKIEELSTDGGSTDAGKVLVVGDNGKIAASDLSVGEGEVAIDKTLSVNGAAADAKKVGDAISAVNGSLLNKSHIDINMVKQNRWNPENGNYSAASKFARSATKNTVAFGNFSGLGISDTTYDFQLIYIDENGSVIGNTEIDASRVRLIPMDVYKIALNVKRKDDAAISDNDITQIKASLEKYTLSDTDLLRGNSPADAYETGRMFGLSVVERGVLNSSNNLNEVTTSGIYHMYASSLPDNAPENATGILCVFKSDVLCEQIYFSNGSKEYHRYKTTTAWSAWNNFSGVNDLRNSVSNITQNISDLPNVRQDITNIKNKKISYPVDGNGNIQHGEAGQILGSSGNGSVSWVNVGNPTDEQAQQAVNNWLNNNPEATSTVLDGSLTISKFAEGLRNLTENDYIALQSYGGVCDGVEDDTVAFNDAISAAKSLKKPIKIKKNDVVKITSEIIIEASNLVLILEGKIIATSSNALKIIGSDNVITGNGTIEGNGYNTGILIGGENKSSSCNDNIIFGIYVSSFEVGVSIYNNQSQSRTVFFTRVLNCRIDHCKSGIGMYGYANACFISNILFNDCGTNDSDGGAIVCRSLNDQYPLDNTIQQIFHHGSTNAITLNIDKLFYSNVTGVVCEQGGNSAKSIVVNDQISRCHIFIMGNVNGGSSIPISDVSDNVIVTSRGVSAYSVKANVITCGAYDTGNRPDNVQEGCIIIDTTLNKPIFRIGGTWVDANGNSV